MQHKQILGLMAAVSGVVSAHNRRTAFADRCRTQPKICREGTIDAETLRDRLASVEKLRADLRFVHLRTHLVTLKILTPHQVQLYNSLRGYTTTTNDHSAHQGH